MRIIEDDLTGAEIAALIAFHLRRAHEISPSASVHALDLDGLRVPEITFWSAWRDGELLGCGALNSLGGNEGEIKSMRTAPAHLRQGVAGALLAHIIAEARRRGYVRLYLETGSMAEFAPARAMYARIGFVECAPFGSYLEDPLSTFMTLAL